MMKEYEEAGGRIFLAREMRGYSREELAKKTDLTPKFIYEIETGRKGFSSFTLLKVCEALGVNCHYIMTGKDDNMHDERLLATVDLFRQEQAEQISRILKEIHELIGE